jgi:hypothetical protein
MPEAWPLEECQFGCNAGACLDTPCTPNAGRACSAGNVHAIDSCGAVGPLLERCASGCSDGVCLGPADAGAPALPDAGLRPDAGRPDSGTLGDGSASASKQDAGDGG